jgi:hypothetical protein
MGAGWNSCVPCPRHWPGTALWEIAPALSPNVQLAGTYLAGLRKNDVSKDLEHFWIGHEDEEIGDRYSKLEDLEDIVAFRKEVLVAAASP